jgi:hypothetical protein
MAKIELITHEYNGVVINQRGKDGFINATAMCQAFDREASDWLGTESTFNLVVALANRLEIKAIFDSRESGDQDLKWEKRGYCEAGRVDRMAGG